MGQEGQKCECPTFFLGGGGGASRHLWYAVRSCTAWPNDHLIALNGGSYSSGVQSRLLLGRAGGKGDGEGEGVGGGGGGGGGGSGGGGGGSGDRGGGGGRGEGLVAMEPVVIGLQV